VFAFPLVRIDGNFGSNGGMQLQLLQPWRGQACTIAMASSTSKMRAKDSSRPGCIHRVRRVGLFIESRVALFCEGIARRISDLPWTMLIFTVGLYGIVALGALRQHRSTPAAERLFAPTGRPAAVLAAQAQYAPPPRMLHLLFVAKPANSTTAANILTQAAFDEMWAILIQVDALQARAVRTVCYRELGEPSTNAPCPLLGALALWPDIDSYYSAVSRDSDVRAALTVSTLPDYAPFHAVHSFGGLVYSAAAASAKAPLPQTQQQRRQLAQRLPTSAKGAQVTLQLSGTPGLQRAVETFEVGLEKFAVRAGSRLKYTELHVSTQAALSRELASSSKQGWIAALAGLGAVALVLCVGLSPALRPLRKLQLR
jgi:hypothetical protein